MPDQRRTLGQRGEDWVAAQLVRAGYSILDRNWRAGPAGELDLVAQHGDTLVFVEVRTRRGPPEVALASALESVGPAKRARLARLAEDYLEAHGLEDCPWRITVVAVGCQGGTFSMEIVRDAVDW